MSHAEALAKCEALNASSPKYVKWTWERREKGTVLHCSFGKRRMW